VTRSSTRSSKRSQKPAVRGVAAGLHVTVQLPDGVNEQAIRELAHDRRVELETMADYRPHTPGAPQSSYSATRKCPNPPSAPASTSAPKQSEQQEPAIKRRI
jgi:DNA-binding transcriptional MocR family regulator